MDFWDVTKLIFRRWYVAVPLLLISAAATVYTATVVKPDYSLTSYLVLLPPTETAAPANGQATPTAAQNNPWIQLGLSSLGQAAVYATQDQTFLDELAAQGHSPNFSIAVGYPNPGVTVEVVAGSPQQAQESTELILERYRENVRSLQTSRGVADRDMINITQLDKGVNLKQTGGKVKRAILAVAGLGLLLSAGVTIGVDAELRRRGRKSLARRLAMAADAPVSPPPAGGPVPAGSAGVAPGGSAEAFPAVPGERGQAGPPTVPAGIGLRLDPAANLAGNREAGRREATAAPDPVPQHSADGGVDVLPIPADATIVLPRWAPGESGGRRN